MRDEKTNDHAWIQGQGQEAMKVGNSTILDHFQNLSPPPFIMGGWQMTTDSSIRGQYLKFTWSDF